MDSSYPSSEYNQAYTSTRGGFLISSKATIQTEKKISDRLISSLRPFITAVGNGIRAGMSIDEAADVAASENKKAAESFIIDPEHFGLKRELLFAKNDRVDGFIFINHCTGERIVINQLSNDEVREVADILFLLNGKIQKKDAFQKIPYPNLLQALYDAEIFVEELLESNWNLQPQEIGIVRLQHASFLLKTSKARIIVDPHFISGYSSQLHGTSRMLPRDFCNLVDAVLITHSHTDHYHIPSLLMFARDTTIIVPNSIETILSPNFAAELHSLGFKNVIQLDWYSDPVSIGDIEISALPFYGEQPLRYQYPRDKNLRNWGNSYFFRTPFFNAFCLIDSGADAEGSMIRVAEFVKQQFGRVDVILSNLNEFYVGAGWGNSFYVTGNGQYWLSLTTDQIANLPRMTRDLLTLGVDGVSEICRITDAKTFLPYSHLWSEIGTNPPNELALMEVLANKPGISEGQTKLQDWRIGDSWKP